MLFFRATAYYSLITAMFEPIYARDETLGVISIASCNAYSRRFDFASASSILLIYDMFLDVHSLLALMRAPPA